MDQMNQAAVRDEETIIPDPGQVDRDREVSESEYQTMSVSASERALVERYREQRFMVDPGISRADAQAIVGLMGHALDGCLMRGTFYGRPANILCLVPPDDINQELLNKAKAAGLNTNAPDSREGWQVRAFAPIAVMVDPDRDAENLELHQDGDRTVNVGKLKNGQPIKPLSVGQYL